MANGGRDMAATIVYSILLLAASVAAADSPDVEQPASEKLAPPCVPFNVRMQLREGDTYKWNVVTVDLLKNELDTSGRYVVWLLTVEYLRDAQHIGHYRFFNEDGTVGVKGAHRISIATDNEPEYDEVVITYELYLLEKDGDRYYWKPGQFQETFRNWTTVEYDDRGHAHRFVAEGSPAKRDFAKWFAEKYDITPELVLKTSTHTRRPSPAAKKPSGPIR